MHVITTLLACAAAVARFPLLLHLLLLPLYPMLLQLQG